MLGYQWNEADTHAELRARAARRGARAPVRGAATARPPAPTASRSPIAEDLDLAATPTLYALEPGDTAEVALSSSTDPELVTFLGTLGLVPGVEVRGRREAPVRRAPSWSPSPARTRTLGERVARQIYVIRREHHNGAHESATSGRNVAPTPRGSKHEQHPGR